MPSGSCCSRVRSFACRASRRGPLREFKCESADVDKQEILEFINKNPAAYMATLDVDGGKPYVRGMRTHSADEDGIVFNMETPKDTYISLFTTPMSSCATSQVACGRGSAVAWKNSLIRL
jgi:pyridoxine/pyridoxamine 5'-phosphate oxidase